MKQFSMNTAFMSRQRMEAISYPVSRKLMKQNSPFKGLTHLYFMLVIMQYIEDIGESNGYYIITYMI